MSNGRPQQPLGAWVRKPRFARPYPFRPRTGIIRRKSGTVQRAKFRLPRPRRHARFIERTAFNPEATLEERASKEVNGSLEERIFYQALVDWGFIPGVDFDFQAAEFGGRAELGGLVADFLFPVPMVVVQVQSHWHRISSEITTRDQDQTAMLQMLGYTVLEIWPDTIRDPAALDWWIQRNISHLWGTSTYRLSGTGLGEFEDMITQEQVMELSQRLDALSARVDDIWHSLFDPGAAGPSLRITSAYIANKLESANYVKGVSGWQITKDGDAEFNNVVIRGTVYAGVGEIAGWTIGTTALSKNNATLSSAGFLQLGSGNDIARLDAADSTNRLWIGHASADSAPFKVTKGGALTATGVTLTGTMQSSNYTVQLSGWKIDNNGDAEFSNIVARGMIRSAVFRHDVIDAVGGRMWVGPATVLAADITAQQTTITVTEAQFANNDFIVLREQGGLYEAMKVTAGGGTTTLTVTRAVAGSAQAWKKGTAVVRQGNRVELDAVSSGAPWLRCIRRTGQTNLGDETYFAVMGDLNSHYTYTSQTFGVAIGEYASGRTWIGVDATNGIRIMNYQTQIARWFANGNLLIGQEALNQSNVYISGGSVQIRNNTTVLAQWDSSGNILVGRTGTNQSNIYISGGALQVRNDTTALAQWGSDGSILIGQQATNQNNVYISSGAIHIRNNNVNRISMTSAGVLTINDTGGNAVLTFSASGGAEITRKLTMPGVNSAIAIGSTPPTGKTSGTGIWIDRDGIYGLNAGTQQVVIQASDGNLRAIGGNLVINNNGISIAAPSTLLTSRAYAFDIAGVQMGALYGYYLSGMNMLELSVGNIGSKSGCIRLKTVAASGTFAEYTIDSGSGQTHQMSGGPLIIGGGVVASGVLYGSTVARVGESLPVYVVAAWPSIGFNTYASGGWKYGHGSSGNYAAMIDCDTTSGGLEFYVTSAGGNAGAAATLNLAQKIGPAGGVAFPLIGTTASAANAFLNSAASNQLLRSTSSARYKKQIADLVSKFDPRRVLRLRPVVFKSNIPDDPAGDRDQIGLLAEEVAEICPELVTYDAEGKPDWVQYPLLSVYLLALLQQILNNGGKL